MANRRRTYSEDEKQAAVALAQRIGLRPASRQLGIPRGSVCNWMGRFGGGDAESGSASEVEQAPQKRVAKIYTPSQRAEILEYAAAHGVTEASKKHGVSRFSIYDWQRKVERAAAGDGDAPTSGPDPRDVTAQRDREILELWERHPGLGPSQIKNQLRRKGVRVSTNTVRRVMEDAGYRPPRRKTRAHDQRFEALRPNQQWHLDFVQRYIHRASTFTLILLDDHSRYVVGHGVDDAERADLVLETFEAAVTRHGRPEMVIHDKGSAFWSWRGISRFTRLLEEMEIEQIAGSKQTNGKLEVFNANLQKELFQAHRFYDVAEMKRRLAAHLHWYNHRRLPTPSADSSCPPIATTGVLRRCSPASRPASPTRPIRSICAPACSSCSRSSASTVDRRSG